MQGKPLTAFNVGQKLYTFGFNIQCKYVVISVTYLSANDNKHVVQSGKVKVICNDINEAVYYAKRSEALVDLPAYSKAQFEKMRNR